MGVRLCLRGAELSQGELDSLAGGDVRDDLLRFSMSHRTEGVALARLTGPELADRLPAGAAQAHYGMIIPSDPMLAQEDGRAVSLQVSFSHPFEMDGMTLDRPAAFSPGRRARCRAWRAPPPS